MSGGNLCVHACYSSTKEGVFNAGMTVVTPTARKLIHVEVSTE